MMDRRHFALTAASLLAVAQATPALAAKPPPTWDHLVRVKSKKLEYVYLLPGADFREYRKVMIDPTELAFKKNWLRDYNNTTTGLSSRLSERDVQEAITKGSQAASEILAEAFTEGGYPVVTEPGPDVLRLRTGVVNISVSAPEVNMAGRSRSFSQEAGYATLIVEARDSVSGALLGRAVDGKVAGFSGAHEALGDPQRSGPWRAQGSVADQRSGRPPGLTATRPTPRERAWRRTDCRRPMSPGFHAFIPTVRAGKTPIGSQPGSGFLWRDLGKDRAPPPFNTRRLNRLQLLG